MQEERHRPNCSAQPELLNSFEHVLPDSRPLSGSASFRIIYIYLGGLLHRRCKECAGQAEDQTEDPHHVDPDNRRCRLEWKTILHSDGCSGRDVDELGEQRDRLNT